MISDTNIMVTFCCIDNEVKEVIQTMPGGEFLWLLLRHMLPKRFRRARDFGLLHDNAKTIIQLVQIMLSV